MIARFLGKKTLCEPAHQSIDLSKVDSSFRLLQSTASAVAEAAAEAAAVIEKEQRRTKACFTALNSASDVIFIIDNSQKIFFVNDQFVTRFNFNHYDDVVGADLLDIIPDIDNYSALWERIRRNKTWDDVYHNTHKLTIVPMMNGKTEPIYYICTLKPILPKR